jgi:hypothetical protein
MCSCAQSIDRVFQDLQHPFDAIAFPLEIIVRHGVLLRLESFRLMVTATSAPRDLEPSLAHGSRFVLAPIDSGSEEFSAIAEFLA